MSTLTRAPKGHKVLRASDAEDTSLTLDRVNKGTMLSPRMFATEKGLGSESP